MQGYDRYTETGTHGRGAEKATGEADTERESLQSARLWTIFKALQIPIFCEFSEFDKHQIGFSTKVRFLSIYKTIFWRWTDMVSGINLSLQGNKSSS